MTNTSIREKFEAWYTPIFGTPCNWDEQGKFYVNAQCHTAWFGYQAAATDALNQSNTEEVLAYMVETLQGTCFFYLEEEALLYCAKDAEPIPLVAK